MGQEKVFNDILKLTPKAKRCKGVFEKSTTQTLLLPVA